MWDLDYKESWVLKYWRFWTVVLEKTLESPLDCKEIQPVNPKGDQSWVYIRRTDAEAETPIVWPPDAKNWLIGKDPDAGKDWRQEEKGMTKDEMVGSHHQLDGHESEQALGVGYVLQSVGSQRMWLNWLSKDHYILLPKNWCNLSPLTWNFPGKNIGVGCHFLFRGSSQVRDQTRISCIRRWILYPCATWELWFK